MSALKMMCLVSLFGQAGAGASDEISDEMEERWGERVKSIKAEIDRLPTHEWAGEYYYGNGLAPNVQLGVAPDTGFAFAESGCEGAYDLNAGIVQPDQDKYLSLLENLRPRDRLSRLPKRVLPVKWGERRYLISETELESFCNAINAGAEPRRDMHGGFLLRRGDDAKSVSGTPELPERYLASLIKFIRAEIVAVGETTTAPTPTGRILYSTNVTLNAGSKAGVVSGTVFRVQDEYGNVYSRSVKAVVTEVGENESRAVISRKGTEERVPERPKVGWKLKTGPVKKLFDFGAGSALVKPARK